jgi:hypothetical protein
MPFWTLISLVTLIGQVVLVVLAIRLFLRTRTRTFALLLWACVSFVIAASSWFTFSLIRGLFFPQSDRVPRALLHRWQERIDFSFQLIFVILMILALLSFLRERRGLGASSV